ncbi:helix-turn-helix domain-containing protein [Nereida sp. MMG025]|uniref:helix-turn-helix domain-containing protein n=1 Tax=Nereida sp. MMG025 TaxID=2909981 RepID=UPI001F3B5EE4|nr:helix-turn-helix transcriptional regulator [Nereida sp. MMG025]MCF6445102.1 helix-turn-helix domain-containing protein [Nereida sp. MMG025]
MQDIYDKRDRAQLLRDRLAAAMQLAGATQSGLARTIGVDRSTISQLLRDDGPRMPNAHVVAECANALGVSADWLLGLSDRPERAADLLSAATQITAAPRTLVDEQIFAWHQEAAGYKIRHVPAGLPDMLKTEALLEWEYKASLGRSPKQAIGASKDRLNWMRSAKSDYEIALPIHDIRAFAQAEGYYRDVPVALRRAQLEHLLALHDQLYPALRVYLFDARKLYSAPITIFGPLLAVIYLGSNYLAFRDTDRVSAITTHFDGLIRRAEFSSHDFPALITQLRSPL